MLNYQRVYPFFYTQPFQTHPNKTCFDDIKPIYAHLI